MESSRPRFSLPPPFFLGSFLLFLLTFPTCTFQQTPDCADSGAVDDGWSFTRRNHHTITVSDLNHAVLQPHRVPGDKCTTSDVVINQGATGRLPNGIPTYTVEIMNQCPTGCSISRIHVRCGWFSSATMVNPLVFKRLAYNDCLVNNGKPLLSGRVLSFKYATTFPYPLSVASVHC